MARSPNRVKPTRRARVSPRRASAIFTILISLKCAAVKIYKDKCIGLAKEAAYSFILSFFPLLVAIIALFFIWGEPERSIAEMLSTLRHLIPPDSYNIIESYLKGMALNPNTEVFWISLAGAFWTASGIMCTIQNAFNIIYEVPSSRGFWLRRLVACLLVVATGVPLVAATLLTLFANQVEDYLIKRYGFDAILRQVWSLGHGALLFLTTILIATIFYRIGVDRKQTWRGVFPGALLATVLWFITTLFFNYYVQNFGSYNRVYGSLGAVIVLLIWMFLTALALLYGAAFNLELERRSPR